LVNGSQNIKQNLNSNDRLKDIHTKLSEIRSENLTDSGHMTELKTEVDDCKEIIKFLETEIGCKNDIISKLLESNTQLTTSCSNSEKMLTTLNEEMEFIFSFICSFVLEFTTFGNVYSLSITVLSWSLVIFTSPVMPVEAGFSQS
jgi:predicted nuclease with TOPRIM domain